MASDAHIKRILIVSGDYLIVQQVRQALRTNDYALQTAYSHRDGIYSVEHGEFDAVFVDADMVDRKSGTTTLAALTRIKDKLPVIGLIANGDNGSSTAWANVTLTGLNESAILHSLASVLHDPLETQASDDKPQLADEVHALFDLSKSLTEVLELSEVLNRVVEAARRLTGAEEGMILLPDDDVGQLYLRAKVGIDVEVARNFRVKTEDTLAGRVFSTAQPVRIGDQGPLKVKTEYLVNALLYVPILYYNKCIGVLGVNNKTTEEVFNQRHQEMLTNLAAFAAVAIENARIHEEALERTRELQMLVEASQAVNASLSLDRTLSTICEQLVRTLNVSRSEIYEWQRDTNQLRAQARYFRAIWNSGQGPALDLTRHPLFQVALDSTHVATLDRSDAALPASERQFLDTCGVEVVHVVPILGGSQVLGAVQLYFVRLPERTPDADTLHRVQHLALEALVTLSNQSSHARQGIFRTIESINHLSGADWCELALLTPDRNALSVNVILGIGVWLSAPQPTLDLSHYADISEALKSQATINKQVDSRITMTPGIRALLDATHSRAMLAIPLVQRSQTQGLVIFADTRRSRVFNQNDMDMGRTLVAQAATALENARLFHDLERSLKELRDTQDRLVQTARLSAMGELAAAVAHQINNPLTTIMVDSEMLLLDENPDSRNYKSLMAISRAGKRAAGVARRLLAIARPSHPESPPQPIDVADTIDGILSLVKSHIERDRIQIIARLPDERLPSVWAVPGQLDDIWLNLLMNAHDALIGRDDAQITISAIYVPRSPYIDVTVADNGPGIPPAIIDQIFKPFFTTKPVGEGTGLGLHICRQTVERIGGTITVESSPGKGTRFLVRLPIKKGAE